MPMMCWLLVWLGVAIGLFPALVLAGVMLGRRERKETRMKDLKTSEKPAIEIDLDTIVPLTQAVLPEKHAELRRRLGEAIRKRQMVVLKTDRIDDTAVDAVGRRSRLATWVMGLTHGAVCFVRKTPVLRGQPVLRVRRAEQKTEKETDRG